MSIHLGRSIKIHLYWAMKNCGEDPNILQQMALNIPNHYKVNVIAHYCTDSKLLVQGDHSNCHASSPCRMAPYIPSRAQITNKKAEEELLRCIKATYVFKNADAFCRVMIVILLPKKNLLSCSVGTRSG